MQYGFVVKINISCLIISILSKATGIETMSRRANKTVTDDVEYLDTTEQNDIIQKLKEEANKQNEWFRYIFAVIFGCVGALMAFCLFHFIIFPYELVHEARFHHIIPVPGMMLFYICSSVTGFGSSLICWVRKNI